MKIYVPSYNSSNCLVVRDSNTLRVYDTQPTQNSTVNYTDYYIHSNYYSTRGTSTFSNYSTLPTCYDSQYITTEYGYRVDFPEIILSSLAMIFVGYFLISKLVRTLFIDWHYA